MSRYMLQHKSFSIFMFLCNMVLFGGLFSTPVFFLYYALIIADKHAAILEAIVLIPAICLAYHFSRQEEKRPERDSVAVEGKELVIGAGLLSTRPTPRPAAPGPTEVRIDTRKVDRVQLKRSSGSGSLGPFYELVLSWDQGTTSIPLNDWVLRSLGLTEVDSRGEYISGQRETYPGYGFVSEVYPLLQHVPWKVTSYHSGKYDTHKTDYEFHGIDDPWAKEHVIESPSRKRRQLLAVVIAACALILMGLVGTIYFGHLKGRRELERQRAMDRLLTEEMRSKGL